jgi:hypothetical protein
MATLHKFCLISIVLGLVFPNFTTLSKIHAADFTAIQSGSWDDPATWGGSVPTPGDNVSIPGEIAVTIPVGLTVDRNGGVTLNVDGTLANNGTLNINTSGRIMINSTGILTNSGKLLASYGANFTNNGDVQNDGELAYHSSIASFINNSTVTNNGQLVLDHTKNVGTINNNGDFYIQSSINTGTLNNNTNGMLSIYEGSTVTNYGTINSSGRIYIKSIWYDDAYGTLDNYSIINNNYIIYNESIINNYNIINNYEKIDNTNGIIFNYCNAQITGNPVAGKPENNIQASSPTLVSPTHRTHTTITTSTFTWNSVAGANSYRLMIYTSDRAFEYKKRAFNTTYTLQTGESLSPNTYQWRVRTQDATCNTWSSWSKRNTLFVD